MSGILSSASELVAHRTIDRRCSITCREDFIYAYATNSRRESGRPYRLPAFLTVIGGLRYSSLAPPTVLDSMASTRSPFASGKLVGLVLLVTGLCLLVRMRTHLYSPTQRALVRVSHLSSSSSYTNSSPSEPALRRRPAMNTFPLTLPHGDAVKPMDALRDAPWVNTLRACLDGMASNRVVVVSVDWSFIPNLLNWLVFAVLKAETPIESILVVALDERVHGLMQRRGFCSVYVSQESVIPPEVKMQSDWSHIWIIRCLVFRILNHWGFDVAIYDVDAIPLRNLQPKFDEYPESDFVGSYGIYPFPLHRKWGVAFCMGVALFRSSESTG